MNWKRWTLLALGGALGAISAVVPPVAVVAIPILGKVGVSAIISGAAAYLGGWATRTPGHIAIDPHEDITAKTPPRI